MKHYTKALLIFFLSIFCIPKTSTCQKIKPDSTRIVYRYEKFPCPEQDAVFEQAASPLPQYCFYSKLSATKTITDSLGNIISEYDDTYYFDDSSNYIALKQIASGIEYGNEKQTVFILEEIKDSLQFELSLSDARRKPIFTNRKICDGITNDFKMRIEEQSKQFSLTGKTKMINGINCSEYVWDSEARRTIIWVAPLSDNLIKKINADMYCFVTRPELLNFSPGLIFEAEMYKKSSMVKEHFLVTSFNRNFFYRITSDGYVLNLGF